MGKLISWLKNNLTYSYLIIAFVIGFAFLANTLITIQLKFDNSELQSEISELENRIKASKQDLQEANTDAYIEEKATKRLGLVKSNDIPVKIYEVSKENKDEQTPEIERQEKLSIYLKDWYNSVSKYVN